MDVILLERIAKLGDLGDTVSVKSGYARNYLLPQKKALRATEENRVYFEREKAAIETANAGKRTDAEQIATDIDGQSFVLIRQAGESGHLYGSVSARDIAAAATDKGYAVSRQQVEIERPIKELGLHDAKIALHPELSVTVTINVALSEEEAKAQALRGVKVGKEGPDDAGPANDFARDTEDTHGDEPAIEGSDQDDLEAAAEAQAPTEPEAGSGETEDKAES